MKQPGRTGTRTLHRVRLPHGISAAAEACGRHRMRPRADAAASGCGGGRDGEEGRGDAAPPHRAAPLASAGPPPRALTLRAPSARGRAAPSPAAPGAGRRRGRAKAHGEEKGGAGVAAACVGPCWIPWQAVLLSSRCAFPRPAPCASPHLSNFRSASTLSLRSAVLTPLSSPELLEAWQLCLLKNPLS